MIWNGVSRETVFILGAGATRGAFSQVRVNGKKICAPLNRDFFKVVKAFAKAEGGYYPHRYERVREVFQKEFPTRGKWPIGMEDAFSLLYVSKDFPEIDARRGPRRKAGSRKEIEHFLRLTYGVLGEREVTLPTLYDRLVSGLTQGDVILTLNYDTLLDSALARAGWDRTKGYGLIGGTQKMKGKHRTVALSHRLAGVKLMKLHGSLNWYVKGSFEKIANVFNAKPTRVDVSDKPRKNEIEGSIRQIIPPVYGKFFAHKHWQTLWSSAHKALLDAEVFVVIGCSLVDTDLHLTAMLSHAIKERKDDHEPFAKVVAVDRGLRVRRKWLRLLKGCATNKAHYLSFEKFARKHLPKEEA